MINILNARNTGKKLPVFLALLLPAILLLGALTACDDDSTAPKEDEHSKAKRLWREAGYNAYEFSQWRDCFCILGGQEVSLGVLGDSIIAGTLVDQGRALTQDERLWYRTVDQLFAFIEQVRAASPASLVIEYDSLLGYPRRISVDYSTQLADDEITYRSAKLIER